MMVGAVLTVESFTKAMEEAVAERGADWVYPKFIPGETNAWRSPEGMCRYQLEDGTPACIIGVALSKIDPSFVPPTESLWAANTILGELPFEGSEADFRTLRWAARNAQGHQDGGRNWGEALEEYKSMLRWGGISV